jgi:hypothetical protein
MDGLAVAMQAPHSRKQGAGTIRGGTRLAQRRPLSVQARQWPQDGTSTM